MIGGGIQQPMRETAVPMTTTEPVHERIQVCAADAMESVQQEAFQIGGDNVNHGQRVAGLLRRCDYRLLPAMLAQYVERPIGIAENYRIG